MTNVVDVGAFPAILVDEEGTWRERWLNWAKGCVEQQALPRVSQFRDTESVGADHKHTLAASALLVAAQKKKTLSDGDLTDACRSFFHKAWQASPVALHAAGVLFDRSIRREATDTVVLYLCAAFAWPLRELVAGEQSLRAWRYLVQTSWNCEPLVWHDIATDLQMRILPPERTMSAMITEKIQCGLQAEARVVLEAILTEGHPELLSTLAKQEKLNAVGVKRLGRDLHQLARLYIEDETTSYYARAIIDRASLGDDKIQLQQVIDERVWDRPFEECISWAGRNPGPVELEHELQRILAARQPHHARRLCEAVILQDCKGGDVPAAISRLCNKTAFVFAQGKPTTVRASAYLSVFYALLNVYQPHAMELITKTLEIAPISKGGGLLEPWSDFLASFLARMTPASVVAEEFRQIEKKSTHLSAEEQALLNSVAKWFNGRWDGGGMVMSVLNQFVDVALWPVTKITKHVGQWFPALEHALQRFFNMVVTGGITLVGNIDALLEEGRSIRQQHGTGTKLLEYSLQKVWQEETAAIATAASIGALQQVMPLTGASGVSVLAALTAAFRSVGRVGALWGIDVRTPHAKNFVADAFLLGTCSRERAAHAVVRYLMKQKQDAIPLAAVGALNIVAMEGLLDGHASGVAFSVKELARICGVQLSENQLGWEVMPFIGAIMSAANAGFIVHSISEAAAYIAAREAFHDRATFLPA